MQLTCANENHIICLAARRLDLGIDSDLCEAIAAKRERENVQK